MPDLQRLLPLLLCLALTGCGTNSAPAPAPTPPPKPAEPPAKTAAVSPARTYPVMLGIDVLESQGFAAVAGKRIGLFTHPAGVNRLGVSTVDVLRHAPGVKLVALFAGEHGIANEMPAEIPYPDHLDARTHLPVFSLYNGKSHKPSPEQLKSIDALVIDLQDVGTRSYTYISAMKLAMEGCFEAGKEVIILDRPNPLGGLIVDGPPLDPELKSYVGEFRVPYVYGLTIGELARLAKGGPGVLAVSEAVRDAGKLTVIPMRGWTRSMHWADTGLKWVATSTGIQTIAAAEGYPMVGLGTYVDVHGNFDIGFRHGIGSHDLFRVLSRKGTKPEALQKDLEKLKLPGLKFRVVKEPDATGKVTSGVMVDIVDPAVWEPTELNFYLMRLACELTPKNPFAPAPGRDPGLFLRHLGSAAFLKDLAAKGAKVDVEGWLQRWREQARIYQIESKKYWLY